MPGKLLTIGSALLITMLPLCCAADALDNTTSYEITIPADNHRVADVTASFVPSDPVFYMFAGANQLPRRWATFISNFEVRDENGKNLRVAARDNGTWQLFRMPQGRVTLSYRVTLDHEQYEWSGGVDGAAYWRKWGVFYTARSLFVVNGNSRKDIAIQVQLPDEWRITAPWQPTNEEATRFVVPDHDVLAASMMFAGTHKEVAVRRGPFEFLLALGGKQVLKFEDEFITMAEGVLDYYVNLVGDVPRLGEQRSAANPVVIINQAKETDGEAIGDNISLLLESDGGPMSQHIARLIFAHEFFHLWNGKSFAPNGDDSEWFKEGFSNYYTLKALHHIGYLTDESYLGLLADLFYQRYEQDDAVGRLSMTNGDLKHQHWGLIYSGGLLVAIAQDLQIRAATGNEKSLDDLMRHMFNEHSGTGYSIDDIEQALSELNGSSQEEFFRRYVYGSEKIPIEEFLALASIETTQEDGRTVFRTRETADADMLEIRRGMFGAPHPVSAMRPAGPACLCAQPEFIAYQSGRD